MCVPAYRVESYIGQAIDSVLSQTHPDWELVIVENASPDRTAEIAHSYADERIKVHHNPTTISLEDNWNLAVSKAQGRYVKLLPADDLIRPECLELQIKELEADPGLALVSCRRDFIDEHGAAVLHSRGLDGLVGRKSPAEVVQRVLRSGINPIGEPGSMLFRREDFLRAGKFDASLPFPMDLEMSIRLLHNGDFYGQDDALAAFRVRPDSFTGSRVGAQGAEHRVVLRRLADDERWSISKGELYRGLARTRVASVKRRLLFSAVSHRWRAIRGLPAFVLADEGQRATKG